MDTVCLPSLLLSISTRPSSRFLGFRVGRSWHQRLIKIKSPVHARETVKMPCPFFSANSHPASMEGAVTPDCPEPPQAFPVLRMLTIGASVAMCTVQTALVLHRKLPGPPNPSLASYFRSMLTIRCTIIHVTNHMMKHLYIHALLG